MFLCTFVKKYTPLYFRQNKHILSKKYVLMFFCQKIYILSKNICSSVKEVVDEVDLPCFLIRGSMLFQDGTDADRRGVFPERLLHHQLCCLVPPSVGRPLRVSIREHDDLMATKRPELVCLHLPQPSSSQPDTLRIELTENHRRLLRLHHTDSFFIAHRSLRSHRFMMAHRNHCARALLACYRRDARNHRKCLWHGLRMGCRESFRDFCDFCVTFNITLCEQMGPEEAVRGLMGALGERIPPTEERRDPCRMMILVLIPVTIGPVVHHLPIVNALLLVDLPEDDTTQLRGPQPIAACRTHHLLPRQIPRDDHRLAELAVDRQALSP